MIEYLLYTDPMMNIISSIASFTLILEFLKVIFYFTLSNNKELKNNGKKICINYTIFIFLFIIGIKISNKYYQFYYIMIAFFIILIIYSISKFIKKSPSYGTHNIIYIFSGLFFSILTSKSMIRAYINYGKELELLKYYNDLIFIFYIFLKITISIIFIISYCAMIYFNILELIKISALFTNDIANLLNKLKIKKKNTKKGKSDKELIIDDSESLEKGFKSANDFLSDNLSLITRVSILISFIIVIIVINSGEYNFNENVIKIYELLFFSTIIPIVTSFLGNIKREK